MLELAKNGERSHLSGMIALAILVGAGLIAWSTFFVGRQIARVLWGVLVVIEKDEEQKAVFDAQREALFGDKTVPSAAKRARRL